MCIIFREEKPAEQRAEEKSEGDTDGEDLPLSAACSSKGEKECVPLSPIPTASFSNSNASINDDPPPLSPQQFPSSACKKDRMSKKAFKELTNCKVTTTWFEVEKICDPVSVVSDAK